MAVQVTVVIDDKKRGLAAQLDKFGETNDAAVTKLFVQFVRPMECAG